MGIDLNPGVDQRQAVDAVRRLLAQHFPLLRLRGTHATGPDAAGLELLAGLGVFGLAASESVGGSGLGLVDEVLVHTELGRHLVSPRSIASAIGVRAAHALGEPGLAAEMAAGRTAVCLAQLLEPAAVDAADGVPLHLIDPGGAALALLWDDNGVALLRTQDLPDPSPVAATDRSVPLWRSTGADRALLGVVPTTVRPLAREAAVLVAAQLLGIAEAARDMAVAHAGTRRQFGQPIGAFQAVKHRCADMAVRAALLRAQLAFAALATQDGWSDAVFQADACRLLAARDALANARANVQVHGALGFTAECDAHLCVLRAHLLTRLGGPLRAAEDRVLAPTGGASFRGSLASSPTEAQTCGSL
jgi:alkylation response protein AidB-like acyl-CoA dehydrogenase